MAFVIKFVKGVRNHWKKSSFLAIALVYGANYINEYNQTQNLMRKYCEEAKKYGDQTISVSMNPRQITVILNPSANKRKSAKQFEKYCAPILHLAGICVDLVQTESEGHARTLIEKLNQTDAIIVAGGDGTLSEVITGLFRRTGNDNAVNPCPVGILPLGRTNTVGKVLFPGGETLKMVKSLADASMAIVEETTTIVDVMKIEIIEGTRKKLVDNKNDITIENSEKVEVEDAENVKEPTKPIYALATFEWGAYRDAQAKRDKYWYLGSLRNYATYIFNGYKNSLNWDCTADINYLLPCEGCSNCYVPEETLNKNRRWWQRFFVSPQPKLDKDYSKITNEKCGEKHSKHISTSDFLLTTVNTINDETFSKLLLNVGPQSTPYIDFVSQGWKTENGENRNVSESIQARQIEIVPHNYDSNQEMWFSIDKEDYEVKPVRVTLLPRILKVFCRQNVK